MLLSDRESKRGLTVLNTDKNFAAIERLDYSFRGQWGKSGKKSVKE